MVKKITLLAGGTGGAKLARGLLEVVGARNLTVIANTADDIDIYGLRVSPDSDLITYWLADIIDEERGWGIAGESHTNWAQMQKLGHETAWFQLGDLDLATCMLRTELLSQGRSLTQAAGTIAQSFNVGARVLPMSDQRVTTFVECDRSWHHFQEYMIKLGCEPGIDTLELRGLDQATVTAEVREAFESADAVVIGPSNPIASIGPILAVPGVKELLRAVHCPKLAVSPIVGGKVVKGPTSKFMRAAGHSVDLLGIVGSYKGLIDAVLSDEPQHEKADICYRTVPTAMDTLVDKISLARETVNFASALKGGEIAR